MIDHPDLSDLPFDAPEGPSELLLDLYAAGEATPEEQAEVDAWLAAHPDAREALLARAPGFIGQPDAEHRAMAARVEQRLADQRAARAADAPTPVAPKPTLMETLRGWLWPGLTLAAGAAAVFIYLYRPPNPALPPIDVVTVKGTMGVEVFRARGDAVEAVLSGAQFAAGDSLRFKPTGLPVDPGGHVLVIGVGPDGARFGFAPAGATRAVPVSGLEPDGALPGASVLDDTVGRTWAHVVWCPRAFGLEKVAGHPAGDRLTLPEGCRQVAFEVDQR